MTLTITQQLTQQLTHPTAHSTAHPTALYMPLWLVTGMAMPTTYASYACTPPICVPYGPSCLHPGMAMPTTPFSWRSKRSTPTCLTASPSTSPPRCMHAWGYARGVVIWPYMGITHARMPIYGYTSPPRCMHAWGYVRGGSHSTPPTHTPRYHMARAPYRNLPCSPVQYTPSPVVLSSTLLAL